MYNFEFKVWSNEHYDFVDDSTNFLLTNSGVLMVDVGDNRFVEADKEALEVLIYTGSDDRNGEKIYNGQHLKGKTELGLEIQGRVCWNSYNLTYDVVAHDEAKGYSLSNLYDTLLINSTYGGELFEKY